MQELKIGSLNMTNHTTTWTAMQLDGPGYSLTAVRHQGEKEERSN